MSDFKHIVIYVFSFLSLLVIGYLILKFFEWAQKITCMKDGEQNTVLGYNIAFDFLAISLTGVIIVFSFILFLTGVSKEISALILGISIGSVLTRTPSFKEKDK